jgi:hypothetical protein
MPPDLVALAKVSLVRQHAYLDATLASSIRCTLQFTMASRCLPVPSSQITQPLAAASQTDTACASRAAISYSGYGYFDATLTSNMRCTLRSSIASRSFRAPMPTSPMTAPLVPTTIARTCAWHALMQ